MGKKKKPESMLTRQRRLLREQRAKKAAAKKAQQASTKSLPPKGKSTASSTRARVQRGVRRDALAKRQLQNFGEAFRKTLKQSAAQSKLNKAAKGTKGTTVRTAQGKGELVKRSTTKPANQRVQKVNVKVDPPKQLKGSSPNQPKLKKAPPAKLPAGANRKALPSAKERPVGKASARRAQAAARAARAAQGTTNPKVRQGQPAGAANRYYGADRVGKAVKRAQVSSALRGAKGKGGLIGTAIMGATAIAADQGLLGKKVQDSWQEWNSRTDKILDDKFFKSGKKGDKPKTKVNRRGRPVKSKATPAKPRVANIPKSEGTGGKAETTLKYGAGKPKPKTQTIPKAKPAGKVPASAPKPIPKATPQSRAYSADSRNKEYDRLRKAGKLKEAAALGKKIYADKFGKKDKKKKPQSRAIRAGYPGNQNY